MYDAARIFFGLSDLEPSRVFLEDARSWAAKRANLGTGDVGVQYDLVVHDCFSGGGVPEQLFTLEFWEDLKAVMHPEAVVVVVSNLVS